MPIRNEFVGEEQIRAAPGSTCNTRPNCKCKNKAKQIIHCVFKEKHRNQDDSPSLMIRTTPGMDDKGNPQDALQLKCLGHTETRLVEFLDRYANDYSIGVNGVTAVGAYPAAVAGAPSPVVDDTPPPEDITYPKKGARHEWVMTNIYGNKTFTRYRQDYDAPKESKENKRMWYADDYKSSGMTANDTLAGLEYLLAYYDFDGSPKITVEGKNPYGATIVIPEGELLSDKVRAQAEKEGLKIYSLGTLGAAVTLSDDLLKFLLKIREQIVLSPDNDESGLQHMSRNAKRLLELADELGINSDIRILQRSRLCK